MADNEATNDEGDEMKSYWFEYGTRREWKKTDEEDDDPVYEKDTYYLKKEVDEKISQLQADLGAQAVVTDEMAIAFQAAKVGLPIEECREDFNTEKYVRELILGWKPMIEAALKARKPK